MERFSDISQYLDFRIIAVYLLIITFITFCQFGLDKYKARRGMWRIPESTLLGLCLIGGTLGGGLGIWVFHHKCSKASFMRVFYGIAALQFVLIGLLAR